jgi:hypothetical protein
VSDGFIPSLGHLLKRAGLSLVNEVQNAEEFVTTPTSGVDWFPSLFVAHLLRL